MSDLQRALKPWDADVRRRRALSFVEATIVAVLPLSAILARWSTSWALALAGIWIAAVALAAIWPTIPARVARHADRLAGLRAVCDTALHLRTAGHPAADAVALDAIDALARASGPVPLRLARPKLLAIAALIALVLFVVPKPHRAKPDVAPHSSALNPMAADLRTLEEAARNRGDLALADQARRLRTELETAVLDVPRAAPPHTSPPPPLPIIAEPEPEPVSDATSLFPPMEKADEPVSKWESDPVGKELAKELHEALGKYMSLDKMKNAAMTKARIMGGNTPFDDGAMSAPQQSSNAGTTGMGAGSQNLPPAAREQAGAAQVALDNLRNQAKQQAKRSAMAEHENAVAMQHEYNEFLKQYAQKLRDRVMETLDKFEKSQQKSGDSGPSLGSGGPEQGEGEGKSSSSSGDLSAGADMQEVQDSPTTLAKVDGPPDSLKSGGGGTGETSPGGAGAGQGHEGTPVSATPEPASGSGDPDRVRGQFRPGSLSPSQQEDLFDALEARAAVEGPFEQFGPEVRPYVSEAQKALESEPVDPRMKSWVESYLRHLAG